MSIIESQEYSEEALNKIVKDLVRPNGAVLASVKTWAVNHNVKTIGSPFEADWQLAYMFNNKSIDYVLSNDGDIVAYGASVMKNLNIATGTTDVFEWSHLKEMMLAEFEDKWREVKDVNLQILHICSFCALLGNDYLEAPANFGEKSVITMFRESWFSAETRRDLLVALETGGVKCAKGY